MRGLARKATVTSASSSSSELIGEGDKLSGYVAAMRDIAALVESTSCLPPKPRCRSKGIVFSPSRIDVEAVTRRHTKPCFGCGCIPTGYRMTVDVGSGMRARTEAYCRTCGANYLRLRMVDLARGLYVLETTRPLCVRHGLI